MKLLVALISLLALSGITLFSTDLNTVLQSAESEQSINYSIYQAWKMEHNKDMNEDRFAVFQQNLKFITEHNLSGSSFTLGLNQFADLTSQEYQALYQMKQKRPQPKRVFKYDYEEREITNDDSINWVSKGAVTPIKNQGVCGSCWAFSAVAGLEGAYQISTGNLTNLSEQQVTSCTPEPSDGCNGGWPYEAYVYTANHGIETLADYPYVQENDATTAACNYDFSKTVWTNEGANSVPPYWPEAMIRQLQIQPISTLIDASSQYFQFYNGGILDTQYCGEDTDHAVLIVAYDYYNDYFTIKNSWGTSWGDQGYIMIKNSSYKGICGINETVDFATFDQSQSEKFY